MPVDCPDCRRYREAVERHLHEKMGEILGKENRLTRMAAVLDAYKAVARKAMGRPMRVEGDGPRYYCSEEEQKSAVSLGILMTKAEALEKSYEEDYGEVDRNDGRAGVRKGADSN